MWKGENNLKKWCYERAQLMYISNEINQRTIYLKALHEVRFVDVLLPSFREMLKPESTQSFVALRPLISTYGELQNKRYTV